VARSVSRGIVGVVAIVVFATGGSSQEVEPPCPLCDEAGRLVERFGLRISDPVRERPDWNRPTKVVTYFGPGFGGLLQTFLPGVEVIAVSDSSEVPDVVQGADVYIGLCTPHIIERGTDLEYIHIPRAGAESCADIPEVAERGILVTNMQRVLGPHIADHAMALLLSLTRNMREFASAQAGAGFPAWSRDAYEMRGLDQKTMLVVGLGGIGTEVAQRAHGFGMRVIATRNSSRNGPDFVDYVGLAHEVIDLATEADVVVNATPLTPDTEDMFDATFFAAMKDGALFINVGRGESVVTEDLVAALQAGAIGGAGLDVMDPEPLPGGHPLWSMPNVVLTPHIAGLSDINLLVFGGLAAENLRRYARGDGVINVVNLGRGY
jgi:phosphoglycerate dehydrogenase-like enzyme